MGRLISTLRKYTEKLAGDNILGLRLGGLLITFILIFLSGLTGWFLEQIALINLPLLSYVGSIILIIGLASTLAARSLRESVLAVLEALPEGSNKEQLQIARQKLSYIVGRDVWQLEESEILRAAAETASENAVDGIFAPLFWMIIGASFWNISTDLPGPLTFALVFKASSTIDSMIGYRHGRMQWLGTAGAKLDDVLTWIPSRIVLLTLPLVSQPLQKMPSLIHSAWVDGSQDSSPNAGISEAIYAHCAEVKMGGKNRYQEKLTIKPLLAKNSPEASIKSVKRILNLTLRLEFAWIAIIGILLNYFL